MLGLLLGLALPVSASVPALTIVLPKWVMVLLKVWVPEPILFKVVAFPIPPSDTVPLN